MKIDVLILFQYQFCNPHQRDTPCAALSGILPAAATAKSTLRLSAIQSAIVDIFINTIYSLNINLAQIKSHNKPNLLAEEQNINSYQLPLPSDQWVLEMQYANNVALAMLQRVVLDYAKGPGLSAKDAQDMIEKPVAGEKKKLCGMIRAKSNGGFR
jgi:hypothetical protein